VVKPASVPRNRVLFSLLFVWSLRRKFLLSIPNADDFLYSAALEQRHKTSFFMA
jgi:hypothetical protein